MRILLASKVNTEGEGDPFTSLLPVGLLTINAFLRKNGFDSRIANFSGMNTSGIIKLLKSDPPSVAGISQFTHNRVETVQLARVIREHCPGCYIVLGGPHASFCWRDILETFPFIDAVAVGEGESTMLELVSRLTEGKLPESGIPGLAVRGAGGQVFFAGYRTLIDNLDSLPFAGEYLEKTIGIDPRQQLEFIITSRGCPSACLFCSSPVFWGRKLRFRSPESMVDELRFLRDRYGLIYFSIRDDTFTSDRLRVLEFCRQLLEEQIFVLWNCQSRVNSLDAEMLTWMKRAGCECIQLGIESGSLPVLQSLGKNITPDESRVAARLVRQAGMRLSIYLIAGTLEENQADIAETCSLIDEMCPSDGQVSPLVYYPGTGLFEQGVKEGRIRSDLFTQDSHSAFYASGAKHVAVGTRRITRSLEVAAERAPFRSSELKDQKSRIGYCHSCNMLSGEYYELHGNISSAEAEYLEITLKEPGNPWGWLALGELYAESGRVSDAIAAYMKLCEVVPAHEPGFRALGELYRIAGDKKAARENLRRADELLEI